MHFVMKTPKPPRPHEILQELRDISSMAMEHFDERVVPLLKKKMPGAVSVPAVSSPGESLDYKEYNCDLGVTSMRILLNAVSKFKSERNRAERISPQSKPMCQHACIWTVRLHWCHCTWNHTHCTIILCDLYSWKNYKTCMLYMDLM